MTEKVFSSRDWEALADSLSTEVDVLYEENGEDIFDYAEDFDSDSEFEMWVEAKIQGDKSVPGYPELYKDQLWKEKILKDVVVEIRKRIKKES